MGEYVQFDSRSNIFQNAQSHQIDFQITKSQLSQIFAQDAVQTGKSIQIIEELGGLENICSILRTDINNGINDDDQIEMNMRFQQFGHNQAVKKPKVRFWKLVWEVFDDLTVQILVGAAILSVIVNSIQDGIKEGWIDGISIIVAVIIVVLVNSINNYEKELQYRKLFEKSEIQSRMVIRMGTSKMIDQSQIVVGDILRIVDGDIIPVDGILVKGQTIIIDESSLTGESEAIIKTPMNPKIETNNQAPFILSGTKVVEGQGEILVGAVGKESNIGKLKQALQEVKQITPLQEKLEELCSDSAYWGMYSSLLIFLVLIFHIFSDAYSSGDWNSYVIISRIVNNSLTALALIAVAVQEGLPVAVSVSLAFSVQKMEKENYLVRQMTSCETMGGVGQICTDKTGTLTTNKMSVMSLYVGQNYIRPFELRNIFDKQTIQLICEGVCLNTQASITIQKNGYIQHIGNKTDCALLEMSNQYGYKSSGYNDDPRVMRVINLNSFRKYMAVILKLENQSVYRVYLKGAPEIVLENCDKIRKNGKEEQLLPQQRDYLKNTILSEYTKSNKRVIALTYKDIPISDITKENIQDVEEKFFGQNLTLLGLAALQDPLRPEVKSAVQKCYSSGITVRMVTGDNKNTAISIAEQCLILNKNDDLVNAVLEGAEFREQIGEFFTEKTREGEELTQFKDIQKFMDVVKPMKVLARATPRDKFLLVTGLKQAGEIVAVTGDGNNDAPALKRADVGIAMGLNGTQVAKDASGIILLDDNFNSIVTAVKWGRNIYDNIRKFIQFQITATVAAIVLTFVGCAFLQESPLNPVQMLWVNLIIDTLASLALATEAPTEDVLLRKPYSRNEYIITTDMWITIGTQSLYQVAVLMWVLFQSPSLLGITSSIGHNPNSNRDGSEWIHYTILFHIFVLLQLGNQINTRKLKRTDLNVFKNFFNNKWFLIIISSELVAQILIIQYGGKFIKTHPLSFGQHAFCFCFGLGSLIAAFIFKIIQIYIFRK